MQNIICKNENLADVIEAELTRLRDENVVERIWNRDFTLWSDSPVEISNRLDWLNIVDEMYERVTEISQFVDDVKNEYEYVVLLGMGGSSLAPEVFSKIFGSGEGYPSLFVIDTTFPDQISDVEKNIKLEKTLFVTSTKSGGTVETISLMKYFFTLLSEKFNKATAGKQFIAITDPGSGLENMAKDLGFSKIFLNNPNIGGRFSALSMFGLVPAALIGVDIKLLLERTKAAIELSKLSDDDTSFNIAAELGVLMGVLAKNNLDKMTLLIDDSFAPIGAWIEQLVAESTGKNGKGVLPVVGDSIDNWQYFGDDRYYILVNNVESDSGMSDKICENKKTGFKLNFTDLYDLGAHFFYWEFATAVAGWSLNLQPFDQPDVESAKIQARAMVKTFTETGNLPELTPDYEDSTVKIVSNGIKGDGLSNILHAFIAEASVDKAHPYISIQAYINMTTQNEKLLADFSANLLKKYGYPVTVGFGPRFLHSTGQLHKGDDNKGIFIQLLEENMRELNIPDEAGNNVSAMTFGTLIQAQSLGDRQALLDNGRKVLRVVFKTKLEL